jgi:hypothetical protein
MVNISGKTGMKMVTGTLVAMQVTGSWDWTFFICIA